MTFIWHKGLPYISVVLNIGGVEIAFSNVLIDSGAASSLFNIEKLFENGLGVDKNDIICEMIGIGGTEYVIQRQIHSAQIAQSTVVKPTVQFGEMDYGFDIEGLIGADILRDMGAVIDFRRNTITSTLPI
ncbi:MAG: hypothetical protein HRT35_00150 [Algicola sp.]|nr:hypothetical protein [Algicola sp.]